MAGIEARSCLEHGTRSKPYGALVRERPTAVPSTPAADCPETEQGSKGGASPVSCLFTMRPRGVVLKKDMGARIKLLTMPSCMVVEARSDIDLDRNCDPAVNTTWARLSAA